MQLLTPSGYKDLADLAIGDEVCAWEIGTGAPIINTIEGWDTITPAYYAYAKEGKRAWVQSYEPIDTWGREYNKPWAVGSRWFKLGGLGRLYEWTMPESEIVTPPLMFYVINGTHRLFADQSVWANGNVTHAKHLKVGDTLYDDADVQFQITSIATEEGAEWVRMHISGDSSYIADGLTLHNADRYMVATSNAVTWDASTTTNWSASDGGATGASVPTSVDNVHATALTNTVAYTVTATAGPSCADLLFEAAPSVSGTITFNAPTNVNIYGNLTLLNGMGVGGWYYMYFTGAGTHLLTSNGVTIYSQLTPISATAVQLQDDLVLSGASVLNILSILDVNGHKVTLNQNSVATVLVGAGTFVDLEIIGAANKTSAITLSANQTVTGTLTITGNSETNRLLVQSNTLGTARTITAAAVSLSNCDFMDITGAGAATWRGVLGSELITVAADRDFSSDTGFWTRGSGVTITAGVAQCSAVNGSGLTCSPPLTTGKHYSITFTIKNYVSGIVTPYFPAGADLGWCSANGTYTQRGVANGASWSFLFSAFTGDIDDVSVKEISTLGNALGNSGITFTPAADQYFYAPTTGTKLWSGAYWYLGSGGTGGAGRVPLPQDNAIFNASSIGAASTTISADMPRLGKDITWTGVTNSPTWAPDSNSGQWYGSLTLISAMTLSPSGQWWARARGTASLTSNGKNLNTSINVMYGCTLSLQDACASGYNFNVLTGGTLTTNGYSLSIPAQLANDGTTNLGASTVTFTGSGVTYGGGGTLNAGTSVMKLTNATATAKTFNNSGSSSAFGTVWLSGAGSGSFQFVGSPTIADLKVDNLPKDIRFTAATNTTIGAFTRPAHDSTATKFVRLPGVAGSLFTTPDSAAVSITGDIELRFKTRLLDYTPAAQGYIGGRNGAIAVRIETNGRLALLYYVGGVGYAMDSFAACGVTDGAEKWFKVTRASATGYINFFTSDDDVTYSLLGTADRAGTAGVLDDVATAFCVGDFIPTGNAPVSGDIYRFKVYNGIGGILVADFNPGDHDSGNTFTSSTTSEVWTRVGNALIYPEIKISSITAATHTLTKSGGGVVNAGIHGNITNSIASPANTFYAGAKGVDGGGNTNWLFQHAPATAECSMTQGADTITSAAANAIAADSAMTQDANTVTADATVAIGADAAQTQGADTLGSAATVATVADVSVTQGADTPTSAATNAIVADSSTTQGANTETAAATNAIAAASSTTQAANIGGWWRPTQAFVDAFEAVVNATPGFDTNVQALMYATHQEVTGPGPTYTTYKNGNLNHADSGGNPDATDVALLQAYIDGATEVGTVANHVWAYFTRKMLANPTLYPGYVELTTIPMATNAIAAAATQTQAANTVTAASTNAIVASASQTQGANTISARFRNALSAHSNRATLRPH